MKARWQDWLILLAGAWLCFSPFWMAGYASPVSTAAWNSYVAGILVALFAILALTAPQRWEEWVEIVLAIWLVISPFVMLFYATENGAAWNTILVGLVIGADAIWIIAQYPVRSRPARTSPRI
jgi:hypothetical protein